MKIVSKNKNIYYCEFCDYKCSKTSHWKQHILTRKHQNGKNGNYNDNKKKAQIICPYCSKVYAHKSGLSRHIKLCKNEVSHVSKIIQNYPKVIQNKFVCKCGKSYKYSSGLSKHKIKCKQLQLVSENTEKKEIVPTNNVEHLLKDILEENKVLREKISNLELGNTINNTHNNQQYSINFFLNEKCKNAMNLEDFVEKIKFTLEDLNFTKENGYAKGISNVFIRKLK